MYETYDDLLNARIKSAFEFTKEHINCIVIQISCMTAEKKQKKDTTMQVYYNGFIGELVKLDQKKIYRKYGDVSSRTPDTVYDISIYDDEKRVTHSFTDVEMKDLTFLGGTVTFGG